MRGSVDARIVLAVALLSAAAVSGAPKVPNPPPAMSELMDPPTALYEPSPSPEAPLLPPPPPPPRSRPPPPQTHLDQLIGTWEATCSQRAVLEGTIYDGLVLKQWAPDNASATCQDRALAEGLSVKFDIIVTYDGHGGITYERKDVARMYRKYHYYYGPAYGPVTANISSNASYPLWWNCLEINNWEGDFGMTSMPETASWLVKEWQGTYYHYMIYNTKTNLLSNTCAGDPVRPSIMPFYCDDETFIVKCEGQRALEPPPDVDSPPDSSMPSSGEDSQDDGGEDNQGEQRKFRRRLFRAAKRED